MLPESGRSRAMRIYRVIITLHYMKAPHGEHAEAAMTTQHNTHNIEYFPLSRPLSYVFYHPSGPSSHQVIDQVIRWKSGRSRKPGAGTPRRSGWQLRLSATNRM